MLHYTDKWQAGQNQAKLPPNINLQVLHNKVHLIKHSSK